MTPIKRLLLFLVCLTIVSTPLELHAQGEITITTRYQVQLRSGPHTKFPSLGVVPVDTNLPAIARTADKQWIQVNFQGTIGWVARRFITVNGDLNALPVSDGSSQPPPGLPAPQPAPTQPPPPTSAALSRAALNTFCVGGQPIAAAPTYDSAPGLHPILLLKAAGGVHPFAYSVPRNVISFNKPQLAACIGVPTSVVIQTCRYGISRFVTTATVTRYVQAVEVRVIVIQTGQVLGQARITGQPPRECRSRESFPVTLSATRWDGPPVTARQVVGWLDQFANKK
jgi:uncharacterized protein YraI